MWEFPGGKVEEGEDARDALRRELREELAIEGQIGDLITRDTTAVGGLLIDLACYRTTLVGDEPLRSTDHDELRWTSPEHLNGLDWALPDLKAVAALRQGQSSP
jgi:8-oxo-dGTP diphosphatase